MRTRKVNPDRREEVQRFVEFPFQLYRDCPQWVPPLVSDTKELFSQDRHPFYEHSMADFFIVESQGQTLGRIAVMENRNFNIYHNTRAAFFGYFEAVDDFEAAQALFEAALDWAGRRGLEEMIGPRGLIGIDGSVLVEGFEYRPALSVTYNYPYYNRLITGAGFSKDTDLFSGFGNAALQEMPERVRSIAERMKARRGFWVKTFYSKAELKRWIPRILAVHRQSFSHLHSYYPPTDAEVEKVINTLLTIADPRLIKLVMKDDDIAGFVLAYHDISAGLQKAKGRLWPLGWFHILRDRRTTQRVNINALGLLPAYQGLGANAVLYLELYETLLAFNFTEMEVIQVDEQNFQSRSDIENLGLKWHKRHRLYRRII